MTEAATRHPRPSEIFIASYHVPAINEPQKIICQRQDGGSFEIQLEGDISRGEAVLLCREIVARLTDASLSAARASITA